LEAVRANFDNALDAISAAMSGGLGDVMESMNQVIYSLVGTLGSPEIFDDPTVVDAPAFTYSSAADAAAGSLSAGDNVAPGVYLVSVGNAFAFNTEPDGSGTRVTFIPGTAASTVAVPVSFTYASAAAAGAGTGTHGQQIAPGVFLVDDAGTWTFNTAADGSGVTVVMNIAGDEFEIPAVDPSFSIPSDVVIGGGPADAPTNTILADMELLLDFALDVLGNVNLESNAMWFQIGANSMQGMILQIRGMHTGVLGGGRGDLAMLIDVREESGIPISEQLAIIDLAEGIVNSTKPFRIHLPQLGCIQ